MTAQSALGVIARVKITSTSDELNYSQTLKKYYTLACLP